MRLKRSRVASRLHDELPPGETPSPPPAHQAIDAHAGPDAEMVKRSGSDQAAARGVGDLQRSAGNQAVVQFLQRQTPPNSSPAPWADPDPAPDPGYQETREDPSFRVRIVAHASPRWRGAHSNREADTDNMELSRKRAEEVRQRVEAQLAKEFPTGVEVDYTTDTVMDAPGTIGVRTDARGSKDTLPDAHGDRTDDAQKHRRVDVFVTSNRKVDGTGGASQPASYRSTATKFWYLNVQMVAGGSVGAAGYLMMVQLTNSLTGEVVSGHIVTGGGGIKASLGVTYGVWGSPTSFSTDEPVTFKDFQNNWINYTSAGLNMFIGYERSYLSFSGLGSDAKLINVSGFNVGTVGLGASSVTGSLTLDEPFPPEQVLIDHSDETSAPYQRTEHGEDQLAILFETEKSDVSPVEQALLESFLSSIAATNR